MRRGFTLIETIIAVGILAAIVALGAFSFSQSSLSVRINETKQIENQILTQIVEYARVNGHLLNATNNLSQYVSNLPKDPMTSPMPSKWAWDGTYLYAVKADGSKTLPLRLSSVFPFFDSSNSYYGAYKNSKEPYAYMGPSGIVQNGGFEEGEKYWGFYNGGKFITAKPNSAVYDGDMSIGIEGDKDLNRGIYQDIHISGKAGDTYVVTYHSMPQGVTTASWYGCEVYIHYKDGSYSYQGQWRPNRYEYSWQTGKVMIKAQKDYDRMRVYLLFYRADGTAYFDDIQIIKQ